MPYQQQGVLRAIQRGGRILLGDEMGLGKTIQALAIALHYQSEWPLLVVCPSSLRLTWAAEIEKWLGLDSDNVQVLLTSRNKPSALVCVASYDIITRLNETLQTSNFRVIVCDESHYLKSPSAKRTQTLVPLLQAAKRAILLTGTPALSRPIELYSQLHALRPDLFKQRLEFALRYCNAKQTHFGWDFNGSSNLPELNLLLTQTVLIRRLKKDVLKDMPPKIRQQIFVEPAAAARKQLRAVIQAQAALDAQLKRATGQARQRLEQDRRTLMMKAYTETGRAKLKSCLEYVDHLLDKECKFLLFAHHIEILDALATHLQQKKCRHIRIDGETPQALRQQLCDQFQSDDKCRAAILSITAAGVGLTLHAATCVVFVEMFWNPGQLLQAEDRAHRVGQTSTVDIKYLICRDSLDEMQWELVQKKVGIIGQSINGGEQDHTLDTVAAQDSKVSALLLEEILAFWSESARSLSLLMTATYAGRFLRQETCCRCCGTSSGSTQSGRLGRCSGCGWQF
eukprot:m.111733 g.111733  ORF g.111733 m.111733 type:complete len:511 (+) comp9378_c0_seq1:455-1987(+)